MDNIRNTQVGHIQIDYRIACAMVNFSHKPCCPDGDDSIEIAKKIKDKSTINKNHLEFFLGKHLDSKQIPAVSLSEIDDFPEITEKQMIKSIFYGSYQLKQCKSYLSDLSTNEEAFIVSDQLKNKIQDLKIREEMIKSKVIACEITSRHKRSEKSEKQQGSMNNKNNFKNNYKIFIQYLPNINSPDSIKGIICEKIN